MNISLNFKWLILIVLFSLQRVFCLGQELTTDVDSYAESEEIIVTFSDGPGNPKDWVGIYKHDMVPGEDSSLVWLYVNGSKTSEEGLTDGELVFPDGLIEEGVYEALFFEDDSYTLLAKATFTVGDVGPSVKTDKEIYTPGEVIVVDFLVGPANPKDWVGLYKVDMVPGAVGSLAWFYVDGTKDGAEGVATGTVTFDSGMVDDGDYKAVFFVDDGYTILAETLFKVQKPAPDTPKVVSISPGDGGKNADPAIVFSAVIRNGQTTLKNDSVKLSLDGKDVTVEITTDEDGFNTVSYIGDGLFEAGSSHKFQLEFSDDSDPVTNEMVSIDFDVASYLQLDMPDPIHFENFNQIEEFELPEDWEVVNLSQEINSELDPDDFTSAYYEGWVNVGMSRWSNSGSWAEKSIFSTPPVFVNGVRQSLDGNALVADSASRDGNFISFLFSKDYDLSNNKDVHLGFYSHYAQNQDSSGSLEYSIDQGESWLPVVYMIDSDDIVNDDLGNIDAVATFEQEHEDIAIGYHPDTFEEIGGFYGAYIASDISDDLAPYISGRINDDQSGSKRYETYRLPEADGQKNVRFRFAKSGTYSWYWGIDNFGLYSIAPSSMPEVVEASPAAGSQGINPMPLMSFLVKNGEAKLDPDSVELSFNDVVVNGVNVTEVKIGVEDGYQINYQVNELLDPLSNNSFKLTFNEDSNDRRESTYSGNFTIGDFKSLKLPDPIFFESFDDLEEFSFPEGWVVKSYVNEADTIVWEEDPDDWTSMSYSGWANTSLDRWKTSPYWNEKSQTSIPPVFVNGKSQFPDGNFLIADSSLRNANLMTVIETKDFDLGQHANVHLGFYSHYCQNQDNSASVEYSIDGGENWLPVIYMLEEADIVVGEDGSVDAVATFEKEQADVAIVDNILFQDEDEYWDMDPLDEPIGGNYGAFIGSPIDATLASHISARVNDSQVESKRYELHSLPQANNQSSVRIRFAMNGTWSWYWAVDNFGLYSISELPTSIPVIKSISQDGGLVTINWLGEIGVKLQKSIRLDNPDWVDVPNTDGKSSAAEIADQSNGYYRLIRE
ncbi:MAG: hypothetical protein CBC27_08975 [Opitutia bacterium TMED67]|nr:hypothetical protein [Verrucomicrobiales bacterium]OUU70281.1 MAG: hypothetical protein CBC27_08975 [Opitutae bacterium TMED67]